MGHMTVGEQLAALIEHRFGKRGKKDAAGYLGISAPYLSDVCGGRRGISAELAVRISRVFGDGVGEDLYRQHYDAALEDAKRAMRKRKPRT